MNIRKALSVLGPLRAAAVLFLALLILVAIFAPLIAPHNPLSQDISHRLASPSLEYPLGTDEFGRDILSRLIYGARVELIVALGATVLATVLGTFLGLIGGYLGGLTETISLRFVDLVLSFPPVIVALLFVTIYGPGEATLILVLGILFSPSFARLVYGQTLTVKRLEYVEAARVFGASTPVTIFGTVLPNVAAPIIVQFPITIASTILAESGLSYLGLGIVPPTPSWGAMVADGQRLMELDVWLLIIPSLVIVVTVLAFGVTGEALSDWLDPQSKLRRPRTAVRSKEKEAAS